jgi:hypothetical protein
LTEKIDALKDKHFKAVEEYEDEQQLLGLIKKITERKEEIKQE